MIAHTADHPNSGGQQFPVQIPAWPSSASTNLGGSCLASLSFSALIWKTEMIIGPTLKGNHRDPKRFWKQRALPSTWQRESSQLMFLIMINIRQGEQGSTCLRTQFYAITIWYLCILHIQHVAPWSSGCMLSSWYSCLLEGVETMWNHAHFTDEEPVDSLAKAQSGRSWVWCGSAFPLPGHAVFHQHLPLIDKSGLYIFTLN